MTYRILMTDNDLGDGELERELIERSLPGARLVSHQCTSEDDVLEAVRAFDPHALLVQWAPITRAVLEAAPSMRTIGRFGIGIDMIDVKAAGERGIIVDNVPDYCIEEVATHAVALGLSLWRRLPALDADVRDGRWAAAEAADRIRRFSSSTVGLIGLGRIGLRVAEVFDALGARVIVCDPIRGGDPYPRVDVATIAAEADLVSLHVPLVPSTERMVGDAFLSQCRRRPIIVNTSRGGLIDPAALASALEDGRVSGAGLDVFVSEPLPSDDPLRGAPNTILTPHAAWASDAALPELRERAVLAVVRRLTA